MSYGKIFSLGGGTSPSGVSGSIQFTDGSSFLSDSTNLFWDNTNKRLGIGTNAPTTKLDVSGTLTSIFSLRNGATNFITTRSSGIGGTDTGLRIWDNSNNFTLDLYGSGSYDHPQRHRFYVGGGSNERFLIGSTIAATIKGSGSTSATTSLLVQNSAGTEMFKIDDSGFISSSANILSLSLGSYFLFGGSTSRILGQSDRIALYGVSTTIGVNATPNTSAVLDVVSTTKGFLPPRMTTAQKNAISTPATGLMVFDTDLVRPCFFNGATWVTL